MLSPNGLFLFGLFFFRLLFIDGFHKRLQPLADACLDVGDDKEAEILVGGVRQFARVFEIGKQMLRIPYGQELDAEAFRRAAVVDVVRRPDGGAPDGFLRQGVEVREDLELLDALAEMDEEA